MADPTKFSEITKAMIKAYFGVASTDTSKDARIDAMLPIAKARIIAHCRQDFEVKTVTNYQPKIMEWADTFFVHERPLTEITNVKEDGVTLVEGTDYVCHKDEGRFVRCRELSDNFVRPYGGVWPHKLGRVTVSYKGGETLPMDVVQVFYETVGIFTGLRTRPYINNAGVEAVATLSQLPKDFLDILDYHVRARTL
jgi:hypothetical protein